MTTHNHLHITHMDESESETTADRHEVSGDGHFLVLYGPNGEYDLVPMRDIRKVRVSPCPTEAMFEGFAGGVSSVDFENVAPGFLSLLFGGPAQGEGPRTPGFLDLIHVADDDDVVDADVALDEPQPDPEHEAHDGVIDVTDEPDAVQDVLFEDDKSSIGERMGHPGGHFG